MANAYTIYKGVSFVWPLAWKDAEDEPIDVTGFTFEFRLLKGSRAILTLTTGAAATANGSSLAIVDAEAGTLMLTITDEEADAFRPGLVTGVMKYVGGDGLEHLMFKKTFTIEAA